MQSPFDPVAPIPGLSPSRYVESFDDAFALDAPTLELAPRDSRAVALLSRRETFARRREREGLATNLDAFLDAVRRRGVGIAGAGLMGISIAAAFLNAEIPVLVRDPSDAARDSARTRAARELATLRVNSGDALPDADAETRRIAELVERLTATERLDELATRPVVVESAPEKPRLKAKLYRELGAAARTPILLLTNTSSLTIGELAATLPPKESGAAVRADLFAGFHFFHPATKRRPVEIAVGAATSGETVARAVALARMIRKLPVVAGDAPGFLVNRLLQAFLNEALAALDEGVDAARIESASLRFGMEGAPLRIVDEIGADVALHSGWSFFKAFPDRMCESTILPGMARAGRLGRKSGLGFYRYASRESWRDDATLAADRETLRALAEPTREAVARATVAPELQTEEALALRAAIATLFEAARLVEEGVVGSLREADAGLVLALGFPASKGGICYWALARGLDRILSEAREFESLGPRFQAPKSLLALDEELRRETARRD